MAQKTDALRSGSTSSYSMKAPAWKPPQPQPAQLTGVAGAGIEDPRPTLSVSTPETINLPGGGSVSGPSVSVGVTEPQFSYDFRQLRNKAFSIPAWLVDQGVSTAQNTPFSLGYNIPKDFNIGPYSVNTGNNAGSYSISNPFYRPGTQPPPNAPEHNAGSSQPFATSGTVDHTRDDWYNPASSPQWTPYNSSLYGPAANTATGNMDNWMYPQEQQAPAWKDRYGQIGVRGAGYTRPTNTGGGSGGGGGGRYGGGGGGWSPYASNYGWNDYGNGYGNGYSGSNYAPAWYMNLANWNIK